ncbi:MAG: M23 family metallopeptidase [Thermodesulfobacteria bacterium]|nr:M23 family metallopeptidase [Thermodesulfobacteriota bacterium]
MKRILFSIFILLVIALVGTGAYLGYRLFEGQAPQIIPQKVPTIIGKEASVSVKIIDKRAGIRTVWAKIVQGERQVDLEEKVLPIPNRWTGSPIKELAVTWQIRPRQSGLSSGKALLVIGAFDASLRNGSKGNEAILKIPVRIDYLPPIITVLSTIHNVRVGGAGAISFRVNEKVTDVGVRVDKTFFKAFKGPDDVYRALFSIPYNVFHPKTVQVEAVDIAGNKGISGFAYRVLPRRKKEDRINISDSFLQRKMPGFVSRFPEVAAPTLIETFIKVNHILRKKNNDFLLSLCSKTSGTVDFKGAFERFKGAKRADFADWRHYYYHGKEVDQAYHLGVDIASIAHARVPAANNGLVVFAGYNGIYGNTVVIDHGMGLQSLYAHLSQMAVTVGQRVEKGQTIGITGSTGLAGGDHLHFGMMLGGVFINPIEWWDRRWIRDHITYNLYLKK